MSSNSIPALLPVWPQAASVLGLSRGSAYRLAASGGLPLFPGSRRKLVITARLGQMIGREITAADLERTPVT